MQKNSAIKTILIYVLIILVVFCTLSFCSSYGQTYAQYEITDELLKDMKEKQENSVYNADNVEIKMAFFDFQDKVVMQVYRDDNAMKKVSGAVAERYYFMFDKVNVKNGNFELQLSGYVRRLKNFWSQHYIDIFELSDYANDEKKSDKVLNDLEYNLKEEFSYILSGDLETSRTTMFLAPGQYRQLNETLSSEKNTCDYVVSFAYSWGTYDMETHTKPTITEFVSEIYNELYDAETRLSFVLDQSYFIIRDGSVAGYGQYVKANKLTLHTSYVQKLEQTFDSFSKDQLRDILENEISFVEVA